MNKLLKATEWAQAKNLVDRLDSIPLDARLIIEEQNKSQYVPIGFWCSEAVSVLKQINPFLEHVKSTTQSEKEAWRYANELEQDRKKIYKIAKMVYAVMSDIYQVCDGANHKRKDMHPYGSDCPIQKRFDDAWDALHQALYEEKEQA